MRNQAVLNFINSTGIYSIDDIENHYYRKTKGHWFSKDSMNFFKSKLNEKIYWLAKSKTVLFISSEKGPDQIRRYSIREYNTETGGIETIGPGFQGYKTLAAAKLAASKIEKE